MRPAVHSECPGPAVRGWPRDGRGCGSPVAAPATDITSAVAATSSHQSRNPRQSQNQCRLTDQAVRYR